MALEAQSCENEESGKTAAFMNQVAKLAAVQVETVVFQRYVGNKEHILVKKVIPL